MSPGDEGDLDRTRQREVEHQLKEVVARVHPGLDRPTRIGLTRAILPAALRVLPREDVKNLDRWVKSEISRLPLIQFGWGPRGPMALEILAELRRSRRWVVDRDERDDVVAEVALRISRRTPSEDEVANPRGYLSTALRNVEVEVLRARDHRPRPILEDVDVPSDEDDIGEADDRALWSHIGSSPRGRVSPEDVRTSRPASGAFDPLLDAIARQSPRDEIDVEMVRRCVLGDERITAVAAELGVPEGQARYRTRKLVDHLWHLLGGDADDD